MVVHYETGINYEEAKPFLARALEGRTDREELTSLVESDEFKGLFGHRVDNAPGYADGGSFAEIEKMVSAYKAFPENKRETLFTLAGSLLKLSKNSNGELSPEDRAKVLLAASQLTEHNKRTQSDFWKGQRILRNITEEYLRGKSEKIPQWDAQLAENRGYMHIGEANVNLYFAPFVSLFGLGLTTAGAHLAFGQEVSNAVFETGSSLIIGGLAFGHGILRHSLVALQNIGKSPVSKEGLRKDRHYRISRHPLYAACIASDAAIGFGSFNPLGWYLAARSIYHTDKACEFQDKKMEILFGDEAREYQARVPSAIPGTNFLMRQLRKVVSPKVAKALETPISHYLGKIPGIKSMITPEQELIGGSPNRYFCTEASN
jgi:protein-S-isoprenylcysteine O-methyltransferase Ste14